MNYEVEVLIKDSPRQADKFVVKWGTAKEALSVKQAGTGGFSNVNVKGGDAPIVGTGIFSEQSGGGKYEVTMQLIRPPAGATAVFTIEAETKKDAEHEAMLKARDKWKNVPEPKSFAYGSNIWL